MPELIDAETEEVFKVDLGILSESLLRRARREASRIISEHLDADHPAIVEEDWHQAAGDLGGNTPFLVQNAINFLTNYQEYFSSLANGSSEGELAYLASQLSFAASRLELEAVSKEDIDHVAKAYAKQRSSLSDHNKDRSARSENLKKQAEEAIEEVKADYSHRAHNIDFIKQKAAEKIGISKRALNKRLSK